MEYTKDVIFSIRYKNGRRGINKRRWTSMISERIISITEIISYGITLIKHAIKKNKFISFILISLFALTAIDVVLVTSFMNLLGNI